MPKVSLNVNGKVHHLDVDEKTPLIFVLRNGLEQCGACKVIVDGKAEFSCNTPVEAFEKSSITTIEGIGTPEKLHVIQQAFVTECAAQCGYCIPGIIVATKALLDVNPNPDDEMICEALSDNLCRCGTHGQILKAVKRAAKEISL